MNQLVDQKLQKINELAAHCGIECDDKLAKFIIEVSKMLEQTRYDDEFIDIKYTDDEFGAGARALGVIKRAYDGDAGIDLPIVLSKDDQKHGITIFPGDRVILHTGMQAAFPRGYWGRIIHRSSTEKRYRLRVIEGVIDEYRGELLVQVHNMNSFPITLEHGQRIAQLILTRTANYKSRVVSELPPSHRGSNGFGSSGV